VSTKLTLAGPFTVEAWVRLDPDISNLDGILGAPGRSPTALDMNFAGAQFRVWLGSGENDIVISKRKTVPDVWTHYAVTRDAAGRSAFTSTASWTPRASGRARPRIRTSTWRARFRKRAARRER
jgi:hypothetical protein